MEKGILEEECGKLLSDFFRELRKRKKIEKTKQKIATDEINTTK